MGMFRLRVCSHLFYLILMTIFVHYSLGIPNDSWYIPAFQYRNEFAWNNNQDFPSDLPRFCFLFTWIATIIWPIVLLFLKHQNDGNLPTMNFEAVERKPYALYTQEDIQPIRELVYQQARLDWSVFLTNIDADKPESCELFYECFIIRPEIKQMREHMTAVFDKCLYYYYMHFVEYMLMQGRDENKEGETKCDIDFYKREGRDGNISQLMYCMKGGYVPNDMIECGLLLWKYFDKEEKIKQLTWKDENDRTIDDIKEYCLTNEARDLVQEWRKECGLNELVHLKERTVGYPRRPSYIESELEDFDIDDWTKSEDGKEEERK